MTRAFVRISELPEDFQRTLLLAAINYSLERGFELPETCPLTVCSLDGYDSEFYFYMSTWGIDDWYRVQAFVKMIRRGVQFPPLVAETSKSGLRDGYHRMAAYRLLRRTAVDFILLDNPVFKFNSPVKSTKFQLKE